MWKTVRDSSNQGDIQMYLDGYPHGRFSMVAKAKMKQLNRTRNAQATIPTESTQISKEITAVSSIIQESKNPFTKDDLPELFKNFFDVSNKTEKEDTAIENAKNSKEHSEIGISPDKSDKAMLGVMIQPVTSELAKHFGLSKSFGALVSQVVPSSPADYAGITEGDILIGFNGKEITTMTILPAFVANEAPGSTVTLTIIRNGDEKVVNATLDRLLVTDQEEQKLIESYWGILLQNFEFGDNQNVKVSEVIDEGIADQAGFKKGDYIFEVNGEKVGNVNHALSILGKNKGKNILLLVGSKKQTRFLLLSGNTKDSGLLISVEN